MLKRFVAVKQSSGGGDYTWLASKLSVSLVVKVSPLSAPEHRICGVPNKLWCSGFGFLIGVQVIVILGVSGWFRQINVASVPASLLQPFGKGFLSLHLM